MQEQIVQQLSKRLAQFGLDIVQPFSVESYNNLFRFDKSKSHLLLPTFPQIKSCLGVVIGNTKHFWNPFIDQYESDFELRMSPHPVNDYCKTSIETCLDELKVPNFTRYAHHVGQTGQIQVAIQHAAHIARFAYYDNKVSFLSFNQDYGTWFALRCVVVFQAEANPELDMKDGENVFGSKHMLPEQVAKQVVEVMDQATAWEDWLKMRDMATLGLPNGETIQKNWRYGYHQLHYHYTKNRSFLKHD